MLRGAPRAATRRWLRPLRWACVLALALTACGKPAVRGRVLPSETERADLPWTRVEVRLLRGRPIERLSELAEQRRSEALRTARESAGSLLAAERQTLADKLAQARAGLGSTAADAANEDAKSPRRCFAAAEAGLARARRDYDDLLASIAPRIAALGVAADPPQRALPALRAAAQKKVDGERRRLRDEHLQSQLAQRSRIVFAPGRGMDHVCWKGENKLDVGLQFRGAIVLFNGKPLPDAVARQVWGLPRVDEMLRIPNGRSTDRDVLLPGREFESCFYARGARLPPDVAEAYGLAAMSPTRGGDWQVQWREISLVAAQAKDGSPADALPGTILARQLDELRAGLEETRLIDAITRSAAAVAVTRAEASLLACHRAIESEEALREVDRALGALESGRTDDPAVQARLRPILEQVLGEPTQLTDWTRKALALVNESTAASKMSELGKPFELPAIAPGPYTLLGESKPVGSRAKLWILPIQVERSVERDLELSGARDGTLLSLVEDVLLRPQRFSAGS